MYGYQGADVFSPEHQPFYGAPFSKPFIKQEHMDNTMRQYHQATMGKSRVNSVAQHYVSYLMVEGSKR